VPDFHLVVGQPARTVGAVCRCGEPFLRADDGVLPDIADTECPACGLRYTVTANRVLELTPPG
jgi:hypothetical protein